MAEPSPADVADAQTPVADEGQEPAPDGVDPKPDGQEPQSRTYSEAHVRQLRRESAGYRTRLTEAERRLQEIADRDKSESERLNERLTQAETRASDAEMRLMRFEVAAEKGLDASATTFLSGTTREEIEASADELAKLIGDKPKPTAGFDGGARPLVPDNDRTPEESHNDLLLQALGRNPSGRRAT